MDSLNLVFAYFGPETVMPVTSILATVAAILIMFGKNLFRLISYCARWSTIPQRARQTGAGPRLWQKRRRSRRGARSVKQ